MIPYILLILIPSIFALFNARKLSFLLWGVNFVAFVLFIGLRLKVGPDWRQYSYIHKTLAYYDFWDVVMRAEPLSYALFWISSNAGFEVYLSNIVAAAVMMIGVCSFARRTASPWVAIVAATPYFIIVMGMSGVRQALAAGLILFLLSNWERYRFITRGIFILVAAMFHTSALVNNIFLVTKLTIATRYKIVIGFFILLITLYLSAEVSMYSENMMQYKERYLEGSFLVQSFGSLYHIAMIAIPAALGFIFKKRIIEQIHSVPLLNFGLHAAFSVLILNFFSSTVASRLTVYLYFIPMMIYPALIDAFGRNARTTVIFSIILFHLMVMGAWFKLGNHSFAYVPYKNIMFDDE